ncbi:MAG TPA: hypothetical protein VGR46_01660, partial [Candidatus Limnocylindria bacterium]|nr:hypothetical protein [Candidatus Limnocylindria bacterium]
MIGGWESHQEAIKMLKALHGKLALALVVGVGSVGLFGAAALGAFGPETSTTVVSAIAPAASTVFGEDKPDRLKQILDALVQKGVITQQQEDAILAAVKEKPTAARVKVLRDLFEESATYLGVSAKELHTKVAGTTLGKIAD